MLPSKSFQIMTVCFINKFARNTRCSGYTVATVLLSIYGHFRQFWGGHASDVVCLKCIILFADVTSLKGAVTSYVTSQCCTCIGHVTFYYKRATDTLVGGFLPVVHPFVRFDSITRDPHVAGV